MERAIIITADGSNSVFAKEINEHYHSVHGAVQESSHIFIGAGLHIVSKMFDELNILEVGFGTGLNALLTISDPKITNTKIHYVAVEPYPLTYQLAASLNYCSVLALDSFKEQYLNMHSQPAGIPLHLSAGFVFNRLETRIEETQLAPSMFHLVYFDAFSPQSQPELWSKEIFGGLYNCMKPGGVLVTYSCKGDVKRALKTAGFIVEGLPGPPGKREITRAFKE